MGVLAPTTAWKPEDDLLLKNAIENSASLESLAKGAVKFSRRFTVEELQDRWYSILYDPIVSAEVSVYMAEFEPPTSNPSSNFKCSDDSNCVLGKRKPESVRTSYYTMRKRISSEPFHSTDVNSLITSFSYDCTGNGNGAPANCLLTDFDLNHHQFQQRNIDTINHGLLQTETDGVSVGDIGGGASDEFHTGPVENNFSIVNPDVYGDDFLVPEIPGLQESVQTEPNIIFEDEDIVPHTLSSLGQFDRDSGNEFSENKGNKVIDSSFSDCDISFQGVGCSIPLNEMPIWRTLEGISEPIDSNVGDDDHLMGNAFSLLNDQKDAINPIIYECDVNHLDTKIKVEASGNEFKSPAMKDVFFAELSDSLLNFTSEDELMFMSDKEDVLQKPFYLGLSSLLVNPHLDAINDHIPCVNDVDADIPVTPDANDIQIFNSNEVDVSIAPTLDFASADPIFTEGLGEHIRPLHSDGKIAQPSLVPTFSSSPNVGAQYPELGDDGVLFCAFNTEVPDIPCNDDIFPLDEVPSCSMETQCCQEELNRTSLSSNDMLKTQNPSNISAINPIKSGARILALPHSFSKKTLSQKVHQLGVNHPFRDSETIRGTHFELNKCAVVIACGNQSQTRPVNEKAASITGNLNVKTMKNLMKNPSGYSNSKCFTHKNISGSKLDVAARAKMHQESHPEQGLVDVSVRKAAVNSFTSDEEEHLLESDEEMPHFSDVEAMILDMDLSPDCSNANFNRKGIEGVKKEILRLEQGAHSCMHRAIAAHGALAVLYGRHSKYYIKKPEVLLGRSTEEVEVDIDLRREGLANKISRRQATIKLDNSGSFRLTNHGQFSISVNGKVVTCGQNVSLDSGCLIQMRGMVFIFETNGRCVKRFLKNIPKPKGI